MPWPSWDDWFFETTKEAKIQEVIDSIFNLSFFVFFGTAIPWDSFHSLALWKLVLASALILLLRRLPIVLALQRWIPEVKSRGEAIFVGWFGPMGVGAIFYSSLVTIDWGNAAILPIVWFIVLASIIAHGVTVPLFHLTITRSLPSIWNSAWQWEAPDTTITINRQEAPTPPSIGTEIQGIAEALTESLQSPDALVPNSPSSSNTGNNL